MVMFLVDHAQLVDAMVNALQNLHILTGQLLIVVVCRHGHASMLIMTCQWWDIYLITFGCLSGHIRW